MFFFFKQKTAYEMRISDWSSDVCSSDLILANSAHDRRDPSLPWFLCPTDLQAIKACGVTFAASMLERVIEEKAKGDPSAADRIRGEIGEIGRAACRERVCQYV